MSLVTFLGPSDDNLQNKLTLFDDIDVNLTHTLVSFIAYWQHLDITCLPTTPYEWCCQP